MRLHRGSLIGKDAKFFESFGRQDNEVVETSNLTMKELKAFIAQEKNRLYGKGKNILYFISTGTGLSLQVTRKQFMEVAQGFQNNGDNTYLIPNYDDGNNGVSIHVNQCLDKKTKTKIYIDC